MSEAPILNAEVRDDLGKGASRRLRRQDNKVPAIVYGGKQRKPMNISISQKEFAKHLENEAFYSQILQLKVGDKRSEERRVGKERQTRLRQHTKQTNITEHKS